MGEASNLRHQLVRHLALRLLHEARLTRAAESGGWYPEQSLRRQLAAQGYDLSTLELRDYMIYLLGEECSETRKEGQEPPYLYKYRIAKW